MTTIETSLGRFNTTLGRYMGFTSKLPQEALEKKGNSLGQALYRGFLDKKWGGPGARQKGLARAELAARTAAGRGTRVRGSLLKEYQAMRARILADRRQAVTQGSTSKYLTSIRRAVSLWQSFVGREIGRRQSGIGVLAVSFLWYRKRSSQAKGVYLVPNRTGKTLGSVEVGDGYMRIVGDADGLAKVDAKYGVVSRAIESERQDMVQYLKDRHSQTYRALFGEDPK